MAVKKQDATIENTEVNTPKTFEQVILESKKAAMKKKVVTIVALDPNESADNNTAYLNCENQYFKVAKLVPLGEKVELEQCLIDNAEEAKMLVFVPQLDDRGNATGNMTHKFTKKYNVVYENI